MNEKETTPKMTFDQVRRIIDERLDRMDGKREEDVGDNDPEPESKTCRCLEKLRHLFKGKDK